MKITIADGLIIKKGKLLLLKKHNKDYFESPGGKLKSNETIEDCLKRELFEEINIKITEFKKIATLNFNFENKEIIDHIFMINNYQGTIKLKETKIFEKMEWIAIENLSKINLAPNLKQITNTQPM